MQDPETSSVNELFTVEEVPTCWQFCIVEGKRTDSKGDMNMNRHGSIIVILWPVHKRVSSHWRRGTGVPPAKVKIKFSFQSAYVSDQLASTC